MTEWKPGDVAMVKVDGLTGEFLGLRDTVGWATNRTCRQRSHAHWTNAEYVTPIRPLVVIDPEDGEAVARLYDMYASAPSDAGLRGHEFLAHALREFANPKPPKPEEPTGLGAVVDDAKGTRWVLVFVARGTRLWRQCGTGDDGPWDEVDAVEILSEGLPVE